MSVGSDGCGVVVVTGDVLEDLRQEQLLGEPLAGLAVVHAQQVSLEAQQLGAARVGGVEKCRVLLGWATMSAMRPMSWSSPAV